MRFGHFDDARHEYVMTTPHTPYPWTNYLGCESFFSLISHQAGGYCFYRDARLWRLTRYPYNNAPTDVGGRYLYVRDGDDNWSPSYMPVKRVLDFYECRHGLGYTQITGERGHVRVQTTYFVPLRHAAEVHQVTVKNTGKAPKSIKLFSYVEFCLWNAYDDMTNFQRNFSTGEVEVDGSTIYHKTEYRERRNHFAFYHVNAKVSGFDTDRESFLGLYNGMHEPRVVAEGKSRSAKCCVLTALALATLCACAQAVRVGGDTAEGGSGGAGGQSGPGTSNPSGAGADASLIFNGNGGGDGGRGEGGVSLAAPGSVGQCVNGRTCDPSCDELVENGLHEYVEQAPDDGSQIPFKDVPTAQKAFAAASSMTGGPCIVEPPDGALFPNNWVRARIRFTPATSSQTIFKITLHATRQANDLVVYTESKTWKIPKDIWQKLAASTWGEDITVTVTAISPGGAAPASSQVKFQIAPALANGSIIYWAAVGKNPGQAWLESFSVGDENVAVALTVPQSQWRTARSERGDLSTRAAAAPLNLPTGSPDCVGCHVAVPDQQSVTFIEDWPWDGVAAMVDPADTGKLPSWLTVGGAEALNMPWLGMMTFSPHVWNDLKQHIMVVAMQNESPWGSNNLPDGGATAPFPPWGYQGGNEWDQSQLSRLGWIDLSSPAPSIFTTGATAGNGDSMSLAMSANYNTSWGIIARMGDTSGVASPTWSHLKGDTIVYASTNASVSGREGPKPYGNVQGTADLWSVPYNGGMGGAASPIMGASDPTYNEYYPSYSPDDKLLGYNRVPSADDMYYQAHSEVFVIASAGGTPTRLAANDAPACMNVHTPGITNSWLKWAPEYPSCNGRQYYWIVFSSSRERAKFGPGSGEQNDTSQLYLTALTGNETASLTSYPGVFIWNQHTVAAGTAPGIGPYVGWPQSNHTPQWEGIDLPAPPPPPRPPQPQPPPT
jgi:hypothetical protein